MQCYPFVKVMDRVEAGYRLPAPMVSKDNDGGGDDGGQGPNHIVITINCADDIIVNDDIMVKT